MNEKQKMAAALFSGLGSANANAASASAATGHASAPSAPSAPSPAAKAQTVARLSCIARTCIFISF